MRRATLALMVSLLLAGCLGDSTDGTDAGNAATYAGTPTLVTLYLDADGGFVATAPDGEGSTQSLGWSWGEFMTGAIPPTWTGPLGSSDLLIVNASVTYSVTSTRAAVTTDRRPELTAWFGASESYVSHPFAQGPEVLAPGDVHETTLAFTLPRGGLAVPAGESLNLRLGSYYIDGEATDAVDVLLLHREHPSRLELVVEPTTVAARGVATTLLDQTGSFEGTICGGVPDPASRAQTRVPLEVSNDVRALTLHLERLSGTGAPDLDVIVYDAQGERVSGGESSMGDEVVYLFANNMAASTAGTWELWLFSCTPQLVEYRIHVDAFADA